MVSSLPCVADLQNSSQFGNSPSCAIDPLLFHFIADRLIGKGSCFIFSTDDRLKQIFHMILGDFIA
jgi:hypothetical protein